MAAAATASATPAAPSGEPGRRGLGTVGRRGKHGKLDGVFRARALRAGDGRALIHHNALVVFVAIIANVFVNRHVRLPRNLENADFGLRQAGLAAFGVTDLRYRPAPNESIVADENVENKKQQPRFWPGLLDIFTLRRWLWLVAGYCGFRFGRLDLGSAIAV